MNSFEEMQVTVIGTGYVGLVTGACLAHVGHWVTCLDIDEAKVRTLQAGRVPIYEPDLDLLVIQQMAAGRLRFVADYAEAVPGADVVFICVGTPAMQNGQADTSAVEATARSLGSFLGGRYCVVVNKSTVPIGSGDWVGMLVRQGFAQQPRVRGQEFALAGNKGGAAASGTALLEAPVSAPSFDVVSNPEFLREGSAIADALHPDRIVVGAESERAIERMRALYEPLVERNAALGREVPFIATDRASAELIKYAANLFLATKISFINEMANICERVGGDVKQVAQGVGLDARIGTSFLEAGIGWGGSCFPKDLMSLAHTAREYGYEARLVEAVLGINAAQRLSVIRKLQERLKLIKGKTVGLWGLAFKPGTDDVRDAPAFSIAARLSELGAVVKAYDPRAMEAARRQRVAAVLCGDAYEAARDADAVVLVTNWPEFAEMDWSRVRTLMRRPLLVDGRNFLDRTSLLLHGIEYCGIGR
jgi:UDPglucose 6-dehydrogenase